MLLSRIFLSIYKILEYKAWKEIFYDNTKQKKMNNIISKFGIKKRFAFGMINCTTTIIKICPRKWTKGEPRWKILRPLSVH